MATEYKCRFQVSGKVLEVGEVQEFASGFTKRNIIVEASPDAGKFSNPVELTLKKDYCAKADTLAVGDGVQCEGFVEGRRWEKDGRVRYFIDMNVKSVVVTDKAAKPTTANNWNELLALGAAYGEGAEMVKDRAKAYGKPFKEMQTADWQKLAAQLVADYAEPAKGEEDGDFTDEMPF